MTDDELKEIYVSAPVEKAVLEIIELKADWFSKSYYLQNQVTNEISIVLETGATVTVDYVPMRVEQSSSNGDLNNSKSVVIQYVNDLIAGELDRFNPDTDDKPLLVSRGYVLNRDLTVGSIKWGPIETPISDLSRSEGGSSISTSSKPVNDAPTGEIATVERVPMLAGFL